MRSTDGISAPASYLFPLGAPPSCRCSFSGGFTSGEIVLLVIPRYLVHFRNPRRGLATLEILPHEGRGHSYRCICSRWGRSYERECWKLWRELMVLEMSLKRRIRTDMCEPNARWFVLCSISWIDISNGCQTLNWRQCCEVYERN